MGLGGQAGSRVHDMFAFNFDPRAAERPTHEKDLIGRTGPSRADTDRPAFGSRAQAWRRADGGDSAGPAMNESLVNPPIQKKSRTLYRARSLCRFRQGRAPGF